MVIRWSARFQRTAPTENAVLLAIVAEYEQQLDGYEFSIA